MDSLPLLALAYYIDDRMVSVITFVAAASLWSSHFRVWILYEHMELSEIILMSYHADRPKKRQLESEQQNVQMKKNIRCDNSETQVDEKRTSR